MKGFRRPIPRPAVADDGLGRPDWTTPPERDPDLLWLDKNENGDPEMWDLVGRCLAGVASQVGSSYPELTALYHRLAPFAGVEPRNLVVTGGADGGIRSVFDAFVGPGDVVLRAEPTYAMYDVYARMYGAEQVVVDYRPSDVGPFLDLEELHATIADRLPRVVGLPNPASPTGGVLSLPELAQLAEATGEGGGILLVDEAYHPFDPVTAVPLVSEHPNVVVVRTFSKAWAMSGLRIGYCIADPEVTRLLHKVRPGYEANFAAVRVAERLLEEEEAMLRSVARLNEGRDRFVDAMEDLGLRTAPSGGNFLLVAFGDHGPAVHDSLADLVLYRRDFGHPSLAGFSRFSATTVDRFAPVVERIRGAVASGGRSGGTSTS